MWNATASQIGRQTFPVQITAKEAVSETYANACALPQKSCQNRELANRNAASGKGDAENRDVILAIEGTATREPQPPNAPKTTIRCNSRDFTNRWQEGIPDTRYALLKLEF